MVFRDRQAAGQQLAARLQQYRNQESVLVIGLARGGVIVASEIAKMLELPLDLLVVRKIGAPGNEELGIGAVSENGETILNEHLISVLGVSPDYLKREIEQQKRNASMRAAAYRGNSLPQNFKEKIIVLVDDGIATGASMRVAIKSLRASGVKKIILAVPVAAPDSLQEISKEVDEAVCLSAPVFFQAIGSFYKAFEETSDEELLECFSRRA